MNGVRAEKGIKSSALKRESIWTRVVVGFFMFFAMLVCLGTVESRAAADVTFDLKTQFHATLDLYYIGSVDPDTHDYYAEGAYADVPDFVAFLNDAANQEKADAADKALAKAISGATPDANVIINAGQSSATVNLDGIYYATMNRSGTDPRLEIGSFFVFAIEGEYSVNGEAGLAVKRKEITSAIVEKKWEAADDQDGARKVLKTVYAALYVGPAGEENLYERTTEEQQQQGLPKNIVVALNEGNSWRAQVD